MSIYEKVKEYMSSYTHLSDDEFSKMFIDIYTKELSKTPPPKFESKGKQRVR